MLNNMCTTEWLQKREGLYAKQYVHNSVAAKEAPAIVCKTIRAKLRGSKRGRVSMLNNMCKIQWLQ